MIEPKAHLDGLRAFCSTETITSGMEICQLPSQPAVIHLRRGQTTGIYSIKTPSFSPYIRCSLGTCSSTARKRKLEEMGFHAHIFDANEPQHEVLDIMKFHSHLISVPPVLGVGDPMLQHKELLKEKTEGWWPSMAWLLVINKKEKIVLTCRKLRKCDFTFCVYGDSGGAWVDGEFPTRPITESAKARMAAEEGWLHLACDVGITARVALIGYCNCIFSNAVDTILKQEPLSKGQKMRFYRKIYNVVDDDPAPREQVLFKFATNLVEKKWPGHLTSNSSAEEPETQIPQGASRGEKRVSNKHIKTELGVRLLYPTYESGSWSIIERMENPF
ncbi:hypothetical protein RND71_011469 [Anisodus tanguticus]|uniref:Uncharacterized protein n=1 Tax=Anisodus tanguticus TaxID=243964 RepID=A0AAE1SDJ8_9SOLA|nr:hypothetical protein RND71_011469 [Anisodus tanguticus]